MCMSQLGVLHYAGHFQLLFIYYTAILFHGTQFMMVSLSRDWKGTHLLSLSSATISGTQMHTYFKLTFNVDIDD